MSTRHPRDDSSKRPGPRNYFSRREQLRLLMLVGTLMAIFILMTEARKPENWYWLTGGPGVESGPPLTDAERAGGDFDTRIQPSADAEEETLPGTLVTDVFRFQPAPAAGDEERAARQAETDIWQQQMDRLDWEQRRELPRLLKAVRDGEPLSPRQREKWQQTLDKLDERWQSYTQSAMDTITDDQVLSAEDKAAWLQILHQLRKYWNERLKEALAAAVDPAGLSEAQREELARFQLLFDELSMEAIRDDTVISRPAEVDAWFRLIELLKNAPEAKLADASVPRVGFRQLFEQPDEYRGQLVRIRGKAKRGYHVVAPKNIVGVEGYYVFVLLPAGGPTSPILVYSLATPEGFPEIKDKDIDKEVTELNESVEFTGYFYKRTAYLAQDGTRVAPVVLAKKPIWTPEQPKGDPQLPHWLQLLGGVLLAAAIGVVVAAWVYLRYARTSADFPVPIRQARPQQLAALADEQLAADPTDALRELEERERSGNSPGEAQQTTSRHPQ